MAGAGGEDGRAALLDSRDVAMACDGCARSWPWQAPAARMDELPVRAYKLGLNLLYLKIGEMDPVAMEQRIKSSGNCVYFLVLR